VTFTDRLTQHKNVIRAAQAAGVGKIVYTGMQRAPDSTFVMPQITECEAVTEELLASCEIPTTLLRNAMYADSLPFMLGEGVFERGIRAPAGLSGAAFVSRRDLAEANAAILTGDGHIGRTYTLTGPDVVSMDDIAVVLSEIRGEPIAYDETTLDQFVTERTDLPEAVSRFIGEWFTAIAAGEFGQSTPDLERILGRRPTPLRTWLRQHYA
jgi:NAD(P)H dehydrogenase (quinone)